MANFTVTIGPNTVTKTISTADTARLIAAYKDLYAEKWFNPPVPPSTTPVPFVPTNAQIFAEFANGLFNGIRMNVVNYEKAQARETASNGVPDLPIT